MNKLIVKLLVVAGAAASGISGAQAQSIPPAQGLTTCAAVYGTLGAYASPENQQVLKDRAMQIMRVALKYNPQAADQAIAVLKANQARINRNDPTVAAEVGSAEKYCRTYVQQYGL